MTRDTYDVCVIGGGSGGFGAACAAARTGARVLLVEAGSGLGGTSTLAGVNNYEPVAGATGLPEEIYNELRQIPDAVAIQFPFAKYHPKKPWGWFKLAESTDYRLGLSRRSGVPIAFEPDAMDQAMRRLLDQSGCELWCDSRFIAAKHGNGLIHTLTIESKGTTREVSAGVFIDATASIHLARQVGCAASIGMDAQEMYDEPSAPESPELVLNNASLCYRVAKLDDDEPPQIQDMPVGVDMKKLNPVTSIRTYPNGDLNMNPLQMMTGMEAHELGNRAYDEARRRILAHWHLLQTEYEFNRWRLVWTSPRLGVREDYRLIGRYVLTEHDVDGGYNAGNHPDIVAISDHAIDFHGARPSRELHSGPFGIPFRCLMAKEFSNLLVACRGASFSSVAASSCRLSRTMMVLGQAAGTAAGLFGTDISHFDAERLQKRLEEDGVALDPSRGYLDNMPDVAPLIAPRW